MSDDFAISNCGPSCCMWSVLYTTWIDSDVLHSSAPVSLLSVLQKCWLNRPQPTCWNVLMPTSYILLWDILWFSISLRYIGLAHSLNVCGKWSQLASVHCIYNLGHLYYLVFVVHCHSNRELARWLCRQRLLQWGRVPTNPSSLSNRWRSNSRKRFVCVWCTFQCLIMETVDLADD